MVRIVLYCYSGVSTSVLVLKMKKAAETKGIEIDIKAFPEYKMLNHTDKVDIVLLGPQLKSKLENAKKIYEPLGIPVVVIPIVYFGMLDGEKVLELALELNVNK